MRSLSSRSLGSRAEQRIALALCAAVLAAWALEQLVRSRPDYAKTFAPDLLPLVAAGLAAAGIARPGGSPQWLRVQRVLTWSGLLLMVWAANGLPFDLLRVVGLIPLEVDWMGLATRALALAAAVELARLALARPADSVPTRAPTWYGYAAFVFALPYPALRTIWALGGTLGLSYPGAGGQGFEPWLLSIPWLMAAALSLFLVSPPRWMPRRLLLAGGWTATAITGMIGPAAFWTLISAILGGGSGDTGAPDIATWVFCLFYGSWFLFAIACGAATLSYQLRCAAPRTSSQIGATP